MNTSTNAVQSGNEKRESQRTVHPLDLHGQHLDELLDEALKDSFPASDPPSIGNTT